MEDKIIEGLAYALPAAVTGFVAYFMFSQFLQQNNNDKKFSALVDKKRESLPIKLQAYERLLLFCERMNPSKLLLRINPVGDNALSYAHLLIANIEQEYEHNMVQQIYITDDSWKAIITAKNTIIFKLRKLAETSKTAKVFRENVLIDYSKSDNPSDIAVQFIKREVKKLL